MSTITSNLFAAGKDLGGLERLFRALQALLHLLSTTPCFHATKHHLNVTRRFMRLFHFSDSLSHAAACISAAPSSPVALLEAMKGTFFGIHGFLETVTVLDLAGMEVWGDEWDWWLNEEAMKMWFLALACSLVVGLVRMFEVRAYVPVHAVDAFGKVEDKVTTEKGMVKSQGSQEKEGPEETEESDEKEKANDIEAEKKRQEEEEKKAKAKARVEKRRAAEVERKKKMAVLQRKFVADGLDIFLPAGGLDWVPADQTALGAIMFITTVIGFIDTWGTY